MHRVATWGELKITVQGVGGGRKREKERSRGKEGYVEGERTSEVCANHVIIVSV